MTNRSQLRPLSKLDQLAETIIKTMSLLSENHHIIQSFKIKGTLFMVVKSSRGARVRYSISPAIH